MIQMRLLSLFGYLACLLGVASSGVFIPLNHLFSRLHSGCPNTEERYKSLFLDEKSIFNLANARQIKETFKVGKILRSFPFPGTCDRKIEYGPKTLSTCDSPQNGNSRSKSLSACCETELSIAIPQTVTSLFSNQQSQVVHLDSSYQLLHEARCKSRGSLCSTGRCQLAYRIQWILVEQGADQTFVPVSVGNHCYCSFQ